jgi:hypothetical protein
MIEVREQDNAGRLRSKRLFRPELMFSVAPGLSPFIPFHSYVDSKSKDVSLVVWRRIGRYRAEFSFDVQLPPFRTAIR